MRFFVGLWAALSMAACGVNEVTVRIEGGDGNKIRLDASELQHKFNRLVDAGSFTFDEVREGEYAINAAATGMMAARTLNVESAPLFGKKTYELSIAIPGGRNGPYEPQGTIVYTSSPTAILDWNLFTIPAAGGEPTQLTDTPEFEHHPAWSPDGSEIAFSRGEVMTNIDIWVMAADGSGERRLTEHPERDQSPAWSPDGSTIAFLSQRDGDLAIWLMDSEDGGNKRRLGKGNEPAWSPDGKRISFTSGDFHDNDEIYIIDADGSNLRRLTDDKHYDWNSSWSPDGGRIAFNSERFQGEELMVADFESGGQMRITVARNTFELNPVWSPDGRALAYQGKMHFREDGELDVDFNDRTGKWVLHGTYDIFVVPAIGFNWDYQEDHPVMPVNLTNTSDRDEKEPSWRPF